MQVMSFAKQKLSVLRNLPLQHLFFYGLDNKETLSVHGSCAVLSWASLKATDSWMSAEPVRGTKTYTDTNNAPVIFIKKTLLYRFMVHWGKEVNISADNVAVFMDNRVTDMTAGDTMILVLAFLPLGGTTAQSTQQLHTHTHIHTQHPVSSGWINAKHLHLFSYH